MNERNRSFKIRSAVYYLYSKRKTQGCNIGGKTEQAKINPSSLLNSSCNACRCTPCSEEQQKSEFLREEEAFKPQEKKKSFYAAFFLKLRHQRRKQEIKEIPHILALPTK